MTRLDFQGKQFVYNHHLSVPYSELKLDAKKSVIAKGVQPRLDGNLIIHGDNLRALKALLPRYEGRVNCIYIDPPYNTGKEGWSYNDNVNMPYLKEWLSTNPINQDDMQRHEKWCCMMWPRLTLLHQLLADDGVVFISIDDNEVHHLRMMMDEIFGEENLLYQIIVINKLNGNDNSSGMIETHEYCLMYAKNKSLFKIGTLPVGDEEQSEWLTDELGFYKEGGSLKATGTNAPRSARPNLFFPIYIDKQSLSFSLKKDKQHSVELLPITEGQDMSWYWQKEKFINDSYEVIVKETKNGYSIYKKQRPSLGDLPDKRGRTSFYHPSYSTATSAKIIKDLFSTKNFEYSKSPYLIKDLLRLGSKKDSIILDSFAGSGTTAHAVLELNKEDGGDRKFILVECEDYADTITAERVRRVIKGVPTAKNEAIKNGLSGEFTFCELSKPIDFDSLLAGNNLPSYKEFAGLVWNLFSSTAFDEKQCNEKEFFIGEKDGELVFCFYRPTKQFLLSNESCLNTKRMEELKHKHPEKNIMVYAPACFVPNDMLKKHNIKFVPLPFALFKLG